MKIDNYLCTMTEIKSMGFPYLFPGSPPTDSEYCVTKLVFGNNFLYNWYYGLMYGYDFSRLPRYQDFLQVKLIINVTKAPLQTPVYDTLFYYQITVNIDGSALPGPMQDIRVTDTLPVGMTLLNFAYVYANDQPFPNPTSNYYTVNIFQSNTPSGAFDISIKPGAYAINRPTLDSFSPITIGFTAKATTTGSFTNTAYATIPSGAFTYQTSGSNTITIATTTTTTTTCNPTPNWQNTGFNCYGGCNKYNVQTDQNPCSPTYNTTRQGSLVESNSTYCGGCCGQSTTPNWQDTGIFNCYGTCNLYYEQQDRNSCSSTFGQTRQGPLYQTNSTSCGGCCGQSTTPNWVNNGAAYCDNCVSKQPEIDNNPCSPSSGQTRVVNGGSACNTTQNWVNTGNYNCYGTCNKYNVEIQNNPCASGYNTTRQGSVVQFNSTFCGGCCGQSTAANWVNSGSYNCYGSCTKYNVEVDNNGCSPTYNQTRQGSAVEFNSSFCGGCCGASPSANWVNNGDTFCDGCYLQQPQIDDNPCSSTYEDTRNADLGVNSSCGFWIQSFYCVGYTKWTKETNTCTGSIRNQYIVEYDSPYCGYVPPVVCKYYQIVAIDPDQYVDGVYTNCAGFGDSFSFYGGPGTVGYVCARPSEVYVTSGNGYPVEVGDCS